MRLKSDYKYYFIASDLKNLKVSFPRLEGERIHNLPLIYYREEDDYILTSSVFRELLGFELGVSDGFTFGYSKEDLVLFDFEEITFENLLGEENVISKNSSTRARAERKLDQAIDFFNEYLTFLKDIQVDRSDERFLLEILSVKMYTDYVATNGQFVPNEDIRKYEQFIKDLGVIFRPIVFKGNSREECDFWGTWERLIHNMSH